MSDDHAVIRLRTLVIFHDRCNGTVTIEPRTPGLTPWHRGVDDLEQVLLPLIDPATARAALRTALEVPDDLGSK